MTTKSKNQLSLIPQPKPSARKMPIPADWKPPERAYDLAREYGQSVAKVEGIFRDYCAANGVKYIDHDAAFCNFIRNQSKFERGRGNGVQANGATGRGSIIAAFDREIAERERTIAARRAALEGREVCESSVPRLPFE